MKEFLEKFGLTEILSHLFPGLIALCGGLLWWLPSPDLLLGKEIGGNQLVLAVLVLIVAYACGLVLSMWSLAGAQAAQNKPFFYGRSPLQRAGLVFVWIKWRFTRVTLGMPVPGAASMYASADITELLERLFGVASMPLLIQPITQTSVFRAAAADRLKEKVGTLAMEAEILRRRFMFSLGVALALIVFARFALARLLLHFLTKMPPGWAVSMGTSRVLGQVAAWDSRNGLPSWVLIALVLAPFYVSRKLRSVAAQCWERELAHTLAIVRLYGHYF